MISVESDISHFIHDYTSVTMSQLNLHTNILDIFCNTTVSPALHCSIFAHHHHQASWAQCLLVLSIRFNYLMPLQSILSVTCMLCVYSIVTPFFHTICPSSYGAFLFCLTLHYSKHHLFQQSVIQGQRSWCQSKAHGWFSI